MTGCSIQNTLLFATQFNRETSHEILVNQPFLPLWTSNKIKLSSCSFAPIAATSSSHKNVESFYSQSKKREGDGSSHDSKITQSFTGRGANADHRSCSGVCPDQPNCQ